VSLCPQMEKEMEYSENQEPVSLVAACQDRLSGSSCVCVSVLMASELLLQGGVAKTEGRAALR